MKDYRPLHLDTNLSKGTVCSKKGYGCKWTWDAIEHYTSKGITCIKKGYGCKWT
jgi:hypothetical protein